MIHVYQELLKYLKIRLWTPQTQQAWPMFKLELALEAGLEEVSRGSIFEGARIILIHIVAPCGVGDIFVAVAKLHICLSCFVFHPWFLMLQSLCFGCSNSTVW